MHKDYRQWHPLKQTLHNNPSTRPFFHEREVWYCHLGDNIGFEQDGKGDSFLRPVVILRKFNQMIFWAIPLTSKSQISPKAARYYFPVQFDISTSSQAILSQIRLVDAKRLSHKVGMISGEDFAALTQKLKELLP